MLAYDYPLLNVFWTMLMLFIWIAWLFLLFQVIFDIFRSHDIGGWAKAACFLLVIAVPLLGVLVYVLARGDSMRERDLQRAKDQQDQMDAYVRQAAGTSGGVADEISKLSDLQSSGVITAEQFEAQKAKLLS
ncbi:MAG: SHOCT domain-containing protein [Ilumatobacter sp.]|nr:SHOCT domain-containing protein [Ilumatobacter sp.]